jgi:predicted CoA-substrate-specific enzyme activase
MNTGGDIITAGLDIGSRTIKYVLLNGRDLIDYRIVDTGTDPIGNARRIMNGINHDFMFATGYGRHLAREFFKCPILTEIKAFAQGAVYYFPGCQTIIDIGGQDCKVIRIANDRVEDFEMNDRCAAGTGKFLEVMAHTLGFPIEDFGAEALAASDTVSVSSMCTVFAESEVISLIARGQLPRNIARGLHQSIVNRIMAMLGKTGYGEKIVFAGGAAKNPCLVDMLGRKLNKKLYIPEEPQIVGALGAALSLTDTKETK